MSECKAKWKNLRAVFVRHVKGTPSGTKAKKKKPYYLTEAMQFTLPFIRVLMSSTQEKLPGQQDMPVDAEHEDDEEEDFPHTDISQEQQQISQQLLIKSEETYEDEQFIVESPLESPKMLGHSQKRAINELENASQDYSKTKKSNTIRTPNDTLEARKMFLLSLLPEINELNDQQMKIFKRKVLQLIDNVTSSISETSAILS